MLMGEIMRRLRELSRFLLVSGGAKSFVSSPFGCWSKNEEKEKEEKEEKRGEKVS